MPTIRVIQHVIACALCAHVLHVSAQCDSTIQRSGKAQKLLDKATDPGSRSSLEDRFEWLDEAIDMHPEDWEALLIDAELSFDAALDNPMYWDRLDNRLQDLKELCPQAVPKALFLQGALAYWNRDNDAAMDAWKEFVMLPDSATNDENRQAATQYLMDLEFDKQYHMNEHHEPPRAIPELSWDADEYLPMLSPDGSIIFFTRSKVEQTLGSLTPERRQWFTWAKRAHSQEAFDEGTPLGPPFNVSRNVGGITVSQYGGATVSVDNRVLIIAASNPTADNVQNIDLFSTTYQVISYDAESGDIEYRWTDLEPLDQVNTSMGWEAQPSISGDGQTLMFAAQRNESTRDANGNLTVDIFESIMQPDGTWGTPTRLRGPVNSMANDKAPFLHPDGQTLYFSSDRAPSGGRFDLWMSKCDSTGNWLAPVNLGLPINSPGDEHGFVVSTDGKSGVFSRRNPETRSLDLFTFPLPDNLKPEPVTVVKGDLGGPLPPGEVTVNLEFVQSKTIQSIQVSEDDGRFAQVINIPDGEDIVLTIEGDNVPYQSFVVHESGSDLNNSIELKTELDIDESASSNPSKSSTFEIDDVQFDTKKSDLSSRTQIILKALANHLERNPELGLRIGGHTDDVGAASDNLALSIDRANAVKNFLIECDVDDNRLIANGFGESSPKADNANEAGRRVNRRTEFQWILPEE